MRAAVVYPPVAEAVIEIARDLLAGAHADVGVVLVEALGARMLVGELVEGLPGWVGSPALSRAALRLVVRLAPPTVAGRQRALRWAMGVPELRDLAWHALGADEPEATLPHLEALLTESPELAGPVATRFALVHGSHCVAAAEACAGLPESTRRVFGTHLEKQLKRVFQVRRWAECRRALFGK